MAKKASKHEIERRVQEVALMIASSAGRSSILRHLSEKYGLCDRSGEFYIARAREQIKQDFAIERQDFAAEIMASAALVARKGMQQGDMRVVLQARRFQAELAQLIGHGNRNLG